MKANKFVKKQVPRILQAASIVIAVFFVGLTTAVATSATIRASVLQFIINIGDAYTELSLKEIPELAFDVPIEWKGEYYLSGIPDDYDMQELRSTVENSDVTYVYSGPVYGRYIRFYEYGASTYMNIDTEDAIIESVTIHGYVGLVSVKGDKVIIAWANESKYFCVIYIGEKDEAIQLAGSVRKIN